METIRKQMAEFKKSKTRSKPFTQGDVPAPGNYKLCPNYDTMFSDTRARVRIETPLRKPSAAYGVPKQTQKSFQELKEMMEVQGSHRTLFYRQPSGKHASSYATVVVDLDSSKKVSFESEDNLETKPAVVITLPSKGKKLLTKGTQTDYRDSEAQTLPWKHEIKARGNILAEMMSLECLGLDKSFPPGKEEVILIEKAREKLAWENVLARLRGKENEGRRRALVLKMSAAESVFKEERFEESHKERMALSEEGIKQERERFKEGLTVRLQRSYTARRRENDEKITYWRHQTSRKLRKMKSGRNPPTPRGDIIDIHVDKTSNIYAPKLRDGENPAHGHEVINIQCRYLKRFHGLEILEKYIADILKPQFSKLSYRFPSKTKPNLCPRSFRGRAIAEPEERKYDGSLLRVPVSAPAPTPEPDPIPKVARIRTDSEEDLYQASLFLGKIIKGRAIQTQKFLQYFKMATE